MAFSPAMISIGSQQAMRSVLCLPVHRRHCWIRMREFNCSTRPQIASESDEASGNSRQRTEAGQERVSTGVAALVDTNIFGKQKNFSYSSPSSTQTKPSCGMRFEDVQLTSSVGSMHTSGRTPNTMVFPKCSQKTCSMIAYMGPFGR